LVIRIHFPNADPDPEAKINADPWEQCFGSALVLMWIRIQQFFLMWIRIPDPDPDPRSGSQIRILIPDLDPGSRGYLIAAKSKELNFFEFF
jgi:hypothetical protein